MQSFRLITTFTVDECVERLHSMAGSVYHIPRQGDGGLFPLRIKFSRVGSEDEMVVGIEYQATLGGWTYDYIPLWDTGHLQLRLATSGDETDVKCQPIKRTTPFAHIVPLELGLWIVLLFVLSTFTFRYLQAPTTSKAVSALIFAIVPLFYAIVKLKLMRNASLAVEWILRQALEKK